MQPVRITKPSTISVKFLNEMPRYFCLNDAKGRCYYFRWMDGKTPRIKFNMPDEGVYTPNHDIEVYKVEDIQTPKRYPELPPAERDRWKESSYSINPNLKGTPAQIFTEIGEIVVSPEFFTYPPPVRFFLLLHEEGHYLYTTEEYCDLFALVNFLRRGYNESTAYYALDKILSRTPGNLARLKYLFSQISATSANNPDFKPY